MNVSVIIPAYNASQFIEKAIKSALEQPEVVEVIIVNDGSQDATEEIVTDLQKTEDKIKLLHHPGKVNRGRSATRNLGIQKAISKYIAFLDSDDFYLSNRFKNDAKLFSEHPDIDGVYNAVDFYCYRAISEEEKKQLVLNTVTQPIEPSQLFEALISGKYGHFQIDGLTVKKELFDRIGLFNEELKVAEDTDIFWKMALKGKLVSGIIDKPLASRGVHETNIFNNKEVYAVYTIKMYESMFFWAAKSKLSLYFVDILLKWIWLLRFKQNKSLLKDIQYWLFLFSNAPSVFLTYLSIKYFPLVQKRKKIFPFIFK
ncbi:glycosyltransferase family 2 protein [Flavobacterium luminosum]|uniref:Glycosyltransferase family 2 protein n=1 Tax=Flavobacterium luminosum TaxID=2949086 RepID=A0ABT0TNL8_9FLAO|nr:glycosyltransferase family A protein [Flavobacterium sp. HXWNR70]MCL9809093.1 glycosyltransferase family 2 protein [Flavobacterium sp. HXWNR70]